jgi:hypothetical protein
MAKPQDAKTPSQHIDLPDSLRVDASYRNTNDWKQPKDVFNRFFRFSDNKGINNTSGFRPKSRLGRSTDITECAFCILVTTFGESEWPDSLDPETGSFTYYGDNRSPGRRLDDTDIGGNRLLEHVFSLLHSDKRASIPPFLAFERFRTDSGTFMRFLGLLCPGGEGISALDDLVAVWRVRKEQRFQNYRATFTVLSEETVPRAWLEDLVTGTPATASTFCPKTWLRWSKSGAYSALRCGRQILPRSRSQQLPQSTEEWAVLRQVYDNLSDREFEFAAAELVQLMDERFTGLSVTRYVQDGGRDVIGSYRVGHRMHQVTLNGYVEAKRWDCKRAVGVKPMMRLIARLRHRDIAVFITTSFFGSQVQKELLDDRLPIILLSGGDIARLLIAKELGNTSKGGNLESWIQRVQSRTREEDE